MTLPQKPVVLFDGHCVLCNKSVFYILKYEKTPHYYFASLQSELGQQLIKEFSLQDFDSILLFEQGEIYTESKAIFNILENMSFPISLLKVFSILPLSLNNFLYKIIAKWRYKIFGQYETCMIPDEKHKSRFLDSILL
ncbi:MAG: DCC1-like thiol-disulfide oxidoreductase family protein [Bacteroidota bacterium]